LKGQQTPVPGIVISDPATSLKIAVTTAAAVKPKEYVVQLTNPVACSAVPVPPSELKIKDAQDYILANGVKADADAMGDALTESPAHIKKIAIEPAVAAINVAVTQDAKDAHTADFHVNMKEPVSCKDAPGVGGELKFQPSIELDATYDTYTKVAAAGSTAASAANCDARRISAAGEGSPGASPRCKAFARAPRAITGPVHVRRWPSLRT